MVRLSRLTKVLLPERRYRRRAAKPVARALLHWFTRHRAFGLENFPRRGPYIVAGNHRGIMEVFLMVAVCPRHMEVLGAGDIPLDPRYRFLADLYGYIPYKRGQMDRDALGTAARALRQGRVVGIFPEGGIWKAGTKSAHRGVAWLSFTTGAPVVPVGFGGVYRAIGRALRLKLPYLETRVGPPVPKPSRPPGMTRRDHMTTHAQRILEEIEYLVPEWDKNEHVEPEEERFELELRCGDKDCSGEIAHPEVLAEFFHTPVLVDVLYTNLKRRGVRPFRRFGRPCPAREIARAVSIVLGYTIRTNPAFFTYRLGDETAAKLTESLFSLRRVALALDEGHRLTDRRTRAEQRRVGPPSDEGAAARRGNPPGTPTLVIVPVHRFRMPGDAEWTVRRHPPKIDRF